MTVEKGMPWGEPGGLPAGGVVVSSDREARALVEEARRTKRQVPAIGLLGGDLCRTLGGTGDESRIRSAAGVRLPVDVGAVLIDGKLHWFVAHMVVRRHWWWGRVVAAMNAEFIGGWDVAPRAHPNDGRLDLLDVTMSSGERLKARSRLHLGTHVPHPDIAERRVTATQVTLDVPTPVYLDGQNVGPATNLSIRIEPDAILCVV